MSKKNEKKQEPKAPLGRPMKGKDRRVQIGVYVSGSVIDAIDAYVEERDIAERRSYSRSDFINDAIELYMKKLGLLEGGDDGGKE